MSEAPAAPAATPASVAPTLATPGATLYEPIPPRAAAPPADPAPAEPAAAEPAPAEPAPSTDPAKPAPLEFKLPEGFQADQAQLTQLSEILQTKDISPQEMGQKLVDLYVAEQAKAAKAQETAWENMQQTWVQELEADPKLGGSNLARTQEVLGKALDVYGGKDAQAIRDAFALTGAGNNPAIVRFIHSMAAALNEGAPVNTGQPANAQSWRSKTPGQVLYGDNPQ